MKAKKIGIVGVYPPPYGGISVHIERLSGVLEREGIPHVIYDEVSEDSHEIKGKNVVPVRGIEFWCTSYLFKKNEDIIHNHFLRWQVRFILSLLRLKGKKVVHTLHSMRDPNYTFIHKIMIYVTGKLSHHFIVVNEDIRDELIALRIPERKISVIHAFIPPIEEEDVSIPKYIEDVFAENEKVILANGGIGNLFESKELYGVDQCIQMFKRLSEGHPDLAFVYSITHVVDENARLELEEMVKDLGMSDRFFFVYEKLPFYPLLQKASLFVRPTRSDGDAISIREALYYGVPVVASDVVQRPTGVSLFNIDDLDSFYFACREALFQTDSSARKDQALEQEKFVDDILNILKS